MPEAIDIQKALRNLCDVNLFCELNEDQLTKVAAICQFIPFEAGYTLIYEGDDANSVYILLKGEVHIVRQLNLPNISNIQGRERILTKITAEGNPLVGETALLGSGKRQSTVRCATACMMYKIDAADLKRILEEDAEIGRTVYQHLAELLHKRLDSTSVDVVKLSAALLLALED